MNYLKKSYTEADRNCLLLTIRTQTRVANVPVCDFCADPNIKFIYASDVTSSGVTERCWRWTVCAECDALIEAKDWYLLKARIRDSLSKILKKLVSDKIVTQAVEHSFATFTPVAERRRPLS